MNYDAIVRHVHIFFYIRNIFHSYGIFVRCGAVLGKQSSLKDDFLTHAQM